MIGIDREVFAKQWADAVAGTSYVSMGRNETVVHLLALTDQLVEAAQGPEFDRSAGHRVGGALVAAHFTSTDTLSKTLALIISGLPNLLGATASGIDVGGRVAQLTGDIAAAYAGALRDRSLDEQDSIYRAALRARKQAEQALASSEARFRQVFYSSPVGVAISEPAGEIIQCNRSLEDILDYSPGELLGRSLSELFAPGDRTVMQERYRDLVTGREPRLRIRFALLRADDEPVWVNLDVSVLPDAEQDPRYFVTMVDDISDLQFLEQRLRHQTLHDPQTGLPNRHYFYSHVEKVLMQLDPSAVITLLHLDLDGFSVVNNGLGHRIGDEMLNVVARRLESVVANRRGMVARLGADEYAILLEPGDSALDVGALAETINTELAEPYYLDGIGTALTATIGVVQRPAGECPTEELMRAASATLRRLRGQGPRQWAPFDPDTDTLERAELRLAAAIPGALENGELTVTYQPVVTLADHKLVGIEAALCWDHPQRGMLSHEQCVRAAEQTGAVHAIGQWLVRTAAEQAFTWWQRIGSMLPMALNLTAVQATDPELVATIAAVLAHTGLPPAQLELRAPVAAIRTATGELAGDGGAQAEDNLRVLSDIGLRTGLHDYADGLGGLRCLAELAPCTVRLAALMSQQTTIDQCSNLPHAARTSIHRLRTAGVDVVTYPVDDAEQAAYCAGIGAHWAIGALFGPAASPQHIETLLGLQGRLNQGEEGQK
jgi:PAS domain S-box-containing protein/diguanylate cyclase (GGDEF)-like protein